MHLNASIVQNDIAAINYSYSHLLGPPANKMQPNFISIVSLLLTLYICDLFLLLHSMHAQLVIPPWPMFMRHPLQWQKPSETAAKAAGTKKKEKRN